MLTLHTQSRLTLLAMRWSRKVKHLTSILLKDHPESGMGLKQTSKLALPVFMFSIQHGPEHWNRIEKLLFWKQPDTKDFIAPEYFNLKSLPKLKGEKKSLCYLHSYDPVSFRVWLKLDRPSATVSCQSPQILTHPLRTLPTGVSYCCWKQWVSLPQDTEQNRTPRTITA